jgi:choline kinase
LINNDNNEGTRITTACLLAAGTGSRLAPLTDSMPKCLTEINGKSILDRLVRCLRQQGFTRLVVVVGHFEHCIRKVLDENREDMTIEYITNPVYQTTNNIYSLWLARDKIQEPFLLIESDLIFNDSLLEKLLIPDKIAISHIRPWMHGTTVTMDSQRRVKDIRVGNAPDTGDTFYKTVNIYSLSQSSWRRVVERLDWYIAAERVNEYYEVVFEEMVADGSLSFECVFFDVDNWYEIDTLEDLHEAQRIFLASDKYLKDRPARTHLLQGEFGPIRTN